MVPLGNSEQGNEILIFIDVTINAQVYATNIQRYPKRLDKTGESST
ncbi:MAG: hypothetical protein AAF959_04085 [Cyanobacteria bacterium P01_D01_bin.56]